jgi:hypothetical protein
MPRFRQTIPIDDYVLDVLMRDLIGHDQQPAAYLVYLYLYGQAARKKWKPIVASVRTLADATGLSKSAIQIALATPPSGASPLAHLVIVTASLCRGVPPTSSSALVRRKRWRRHSLNAAYIKIFCVPFVEKFDRDPIDTTRIL